MLICMRTTLNVDDDLMRRVKRRAAATGRTITAIVETGLRDLLERESLLQQRSYTLRWTTVPDGAQPGVDLADRDSQFERMEGEP
jgi:hypothetical protein